METKKQGSDQFINVIEFHGNQEISGNSQQTPSDKKLKFSWFMLQKRTYGCSSCVQVPGCC
jgi:hypothetical protein